MIYAVDAPWRIVIVSTVQPAVEGFAEIARALGHEPVAVVTSQGPQGRRETHQSCLLDDLAPTGCDAQTCRIEMIQRRPSVDRLRQPRVEVVGRQDDRLPLGRVVLGHQLVRLGRQERVRLQRLLTLVPPLPQAGEREQRQVG